MADDGRSEDHTQGGQPGHSPSHSPSQSQSQSQNENHSQIKPPPFTLSPIQAACLDFCIELLNQRIRVDEYECAFIYALAVIGRGKTGWRTPESYPPILSKVIKVARFMVVNKAL
jgi:hypothetical protein